METFIRDLRFSCRALGQRPTVTLAAVLALGLAIGSTTAMFSVINAVLLKPLNFGDPAGVVRVWESNPTAGFDIFPASAANFLDWQGQNTVFSSIAAFETAAVTLTGLDGGAERWNAPASRVSSSRSCAPMPSLAALSPSRTKTRPTIRWPWSAMDSG